MKEVIFQDMVKSDRKKRLLCLHEAFVDGNYRYIAERKTFFRVKETDIFKTSVLANKWVQGQLNEDSSKGHVSILRVRDTKKGEYLFKSKFSGVIYIVYENAVLTLSFLQAATVAAYKVQL